MNVIFFHKAHWWEVDSAIRARAGWEYGGLRHSTPRDQDFYTHGCQQLDTHKADGSAVESRFHIRLKENYDEYPDASTVGPDYATGGDAHHEDIIFRGFAEFPCHAVDKGTAREPTPNGSGFDQGRRELENSFTGHYNYAVYVGNTREFLQCDGDFAGSDGYIRYIQLDVSY